jgi:hypothetical protein
MDKAFISGLLSLAQQAATAIVPGAGAAIIAGKKVLELIDTVRDNVTSTADAAALDEGRAELERRINEHADRTAQSLD